MKFKRAQFPVTLALIFGGSLLLAGCDDHQPNTDQDKAPSVNVKVFETQPLNYTIKLSLPARVIASQVAEIRPQVSGIILKREFEESSNVKAGQSLYQIDPAIYQANYDSAIANVASAEASDKIAHLTLKRYEGLLKTKSISQQDYDKASADALQADAAVLVAKANLHTAKVNLDYTKVYSPIDGYIGKSNVTQGALVSAGQQTPMALVQTLDPIYVDMTQAATIFERNEKNRGVLYQPQGKVELFFNDGTRYEHEGYIKFSDKTVNETTGTVTLRAEFANPDAKILPGMFIKPQWTLGNIDNALLVPQKGITSDPAGNYTAIVAVPLPEEEAQKIRVQQSTAQTGNTKKDNTLYYFEKRNNVKIYSGIAGYWIVTDGINAGEKVVTTGLLNLAGQNLNDPNHRIIANIIDKPETLTQDQLDKIVESNLK